MAWQQSELDKLLAFHLVSCRRVLLLCLTDLHVLCQHLNHCLTASQPGAQASAAASLAQQKS